MNTPLVRNTDPRESHMAAAMIKRTAKKDCILVMLELLERGPSTAREIALALASDKGTARIESLRRRMSDVTAEGWAVHVGTRDRSGVFEITPAGESYLEKRDAEL